MKRQCILLCLLALLLACGTDPADVSSRLQDLESSIGETVSAETGRDLAVDCPEREEWKAGDTFGCAATLPNGKQYMEVDVTLGEDISDTSFRFLEDRPFVP